MQFVRLILIYIHFIHEQLSYKGPEDFIQRRRRKRKISCQIFCSFNSKKSNILSNICSENITGQTNLNDNIVEKISRIQFPLRGETDFHTISSGNCMKIGLKSQILLSYILKSIYEQMNTLTVCDILNNWKLTPCGREPSQTRMMRM